MNEKRKQVGNWVVELNKENRLGEGGMGEVYLAKHITLGNLAAIKFLPPALSNDQEFNKRFFEEAKTQARLKHQNIAQVMDCIRENGQLFLLMEYLEGGTLADVIDKTKSGIEEKQAIKWIKQVLDALNYAHQNRVIHRDIKPTNIMLDKHGNAKVVDFGIALEMTADRRTRTGISIGTPHYMSPEQITRPKGVDHRTDVYSTSVVLYEMLTRKVPFDGDSDFIIKEAQVRSNPPLLRSINPAISKDLEEIVLRGLCKDPNQRYSGCGEFLRVIEQYEKNMKTSSYNFKETVSKPVTQPAYVQFKGISKQESKPNKQNFAPEFRFLEISPVLTSLSIEIADNYQSLLFHPLKFFRDAFEPDFIGRRRMRYLRVGRVGAFIWMCGLIFYLNIIFYHTTTLIEPKEELKKIVDLTPLKISYNLPAPKPAVVPPSIVRRSEGVIRGNALERPSPDYPALAKTAHVEGDVVVEITIDEDGSVVAARVVNGHPLLQQAALSAAKRWKFKPTLLSNTAVKVSGVLTFRFKL